ncbi:hypothetical protein B296_00035864 [Ensete ventricosum]|uniref:Uncharacterized protein n=1 Tax=Ensete ventricosum TaxID=4639 RepID=A0A426XRH8_ENSVE|nr:hypothetical protein B296_00035864 [Ensete ventricosum]
MGGRKKSEKKREKKRENLEIRRCSPDLNPSLAGFSKRRESSAIEGRRKRRATHGLLAEASPGDFFSPHGLLEEKKRLPALGEGTM